MIETLRQTSRRTLTVVGVVLILAALAFAYLLDVGGSESGFEADPLGWLIVSAIASLILAALMLRLVPRTEEDPDTGNKPARIGLVLSIVSLVAGVVFWTGLPFAIGLPALVLGAEGVGRAGTQGRRPEATAAMFISAFAIVASFITCIIG